MPKTTHDLELKTSIQTFDAFVRCTLMGNQPWSQFENGIRERSIALKMVKVSKLAQRELIPHRSIVGLGAFIQKHVFVVLLIHNINPTAEKSSKN